ncbi:MAG: rRNA maturation RNase YbeY [Gemmatimonadota bacterium]
MRSTGPAVFVARAGVRVPLAGRSVGEIARRVLVAEGATEAHLDITFVTSLAIAKIHRQTFGDGKVTDVVTLQHRDAPEGRIIGEVFIAPAVAARNARRLGRPVREELARLVVHGALHATGWSHPEAESGYRSPMWRRQEQLLRGFRRSRLF